MPDGTTAQVQGVAQMDPGQGAVHTLAEVASQHSSLEVGHSSDLQENGHIIITGDDGQGRKNIIWIINHFHEKENQDQIVKSESELNAN